MADSYFDILTKANSDAKPHGFDAELILSHQYYDDSTRAPTISRLDQLGLGLANNDRPLQISLLRRVIDKLAVLYVRPATRWLKRQGSLLEEQGSDHETLLEVYYRANADLAFRRIDRLVSLMRQLVIRVYPSDAHGSCVLRVFEPYNVMRSPDWTTPDILDADSQFALRLGNDTYEHWCKIENHWHYRVTSKQGYAESQWQPNPFAELPVHLIYDEYNGGQAWLHPRVSRVAWVEAVNAVANDLWALIANEAHTTKVVTSDNPSDLPSEGGPNQIWHLPTGASFEQVAANPRISECNAVLESFVRLWTLSEDLPNSEFDRTKSIVTGAARKVEMQSLMDRREARVPLAKRDEMQIYRKIRAVHNAYAGTSAKWDLPELPMDTDLQVEFAPLTVPSDSMDQQQANARSMVLGIKSKIDVAQDELQVTRAEAKDIVARVARDNAEYGVSAVGSSDIDQGPGPQLAEADSTTDELQAADAPDTTPTQSAEKVADTALNGAQVSSLLEVLQSVATGQLPRESAAALLEEAFQMEPVRAQKILGTLGRGFKPTPPPEVEPPVA